MSKNETAVKFLSSTTYASANRAAASAISLALQGGDSVDTYFQLRAQAGELLNSIRNKNGFKSIAQTGLYRGQEAYFYREGSTGLMAAFAEDEKVYEGNIWDEKEFSGILSFEMDRMIGHLTLFKLGIAPGISGPAASLTWKELAPLILPDVAHSAVRAFESLTRFVDATDSPSAKGKSAEKARERGQIAAGYGMDNSMVFQTNNGNEIECRFSDVEGTALSGLMDYIGTAAVPSLQSNRSAGISHSLIIQNFTGEDLELKVVHQNKGCGMLIGPHQAFSGSTIPAFLNRNEEINGAGMVADRPLCGEASMLWGSNSEDGDIGYAIEIAVGGTSHKISIGFDLPQLGTNSSYAFFNPSASAEDLYKENHGKNSDLAFSRGHDDIGISIGTNSTTEKTECLRTGKTGYFYRTVIAIYHKTEHPNKIGHSPLEGLFYGSDY